MTILDNEDLPALQREVQRLLGRCMLRVQQYERLIKAMVADHKISGLFHGLELARAARIDDTARKTLGTLVGDLLGSYIVADEVAPQIADAFFLRTRSAAVSANARSLRASSRSRPLIRFLSSLVA
jgi:hypothetical protein